MSATLAMSDGGKTHYLVAGLSLSFSGLLALVMAAKNLSDHEAALKELTPQEAEELEAEEERKVRKPFNPRTTGIMHIFVALLMILAGVVFVAKSRL